MKEKPIGVTILGCLEIISGTTGSIFSLFLLYYFIKMAQQDINADFLLIFITFSIPAASSIILFICGIGIIQLKRWAWKTNIYLLPIFFVATIFIFIKLNQIMPTSIFARISNIIHPFFELIFPLVIIIYLNSKNIKNNFLNSPE